MYATSNSLGPAVNDDFEIALDKFKSAIEALEFELGSVHAQKQVCRKSRSVWVAARIWANGRLYELTKYKKTQTVELFERAMAAFGTTVNQFAKNVRERYETLPQVFPKRLVSAAGHQA